MPLLLLLLLPLDSQSYILPSKLDLCYVKVSWASLCCWGPSMPPWSLMATNQAWCPFHIGHNYWPKPDIQITYLCFIERFLTSKPSPWSQVFSPLHLALPVVIIPMKLIISYQAPTSKISISHAKKKKNPCEILLLSFKFSKTIASLTF